MFLPKLSARCTPLHTHNGLKIEEEPFLTVWKISNDTYYVTETRLRDNNSGNKSKHLQMYSRNVIGSKKGNDIKI